MCRGAQAPGLHLHVSRSRTDSLSVCARRSGPDTATSGVQCPRVGAVFVEIGSGIGGTPSPATRSNQPQEVRRLKRSRHRYCQGCLDKQRKIDRLEAQVQQLRGKLRYQERTAQEGFFGASTPSSKLPVKANTLAERQARRGGGKPGHPGHKRHALRPEQADQLERVRTMDLCPDCGIPLHGHRLVRRTVIDCQPVRRIQKVLELEHKHCPRCGRRFRARPTGVLPKTLYGNQLLALVAVEHYVDGLTLGYLEQPTGVPYSRWISAMHTLARIFRSIPDQLIAEYRRAVVKHADETGWRTDGHNG